MAIASCLALVLPLAAASPKNVPPLMTTFDGAPVTTREEWENIRRPEILECFTRNEFGVRPASMADGRDVSYTVVSDTEILDGKARKKLAEAVYNGPNGEYSWRFVAVFPKNARKMPTLVFFDVSSDTDLLTEAETYDTARWPAKKIVERGFATAYIFKSAIAPDDAGNADFKAGIFPAAEDPAERGEESWATISAWAWGNSRVFDWLSRQPEVDSSRIAIVGHSRGGKTALWTGATDTRFALVHANESGCGGAKLNHIDLPSSEHISQITSSFPHWFCKNYSKYSGKETSMPFDQHMLAALIAPRPLEISSATKDTWAGPEGEWWTASLASPAWELYGKTGLAASSIPSPESPQMDGTISYFLRTGTHAMTEYDWARVMDFAMKQGWKDRYWVAQDGTGEWTDEANWSDAPGGEGGATAPTANEIVRFSLSGNVVDLAGGVRSASTVLFDGVSDENRKSLLVTNGTLVISGDSWPTSGQHEFFNGGTIVFAQDAKLVNNNAAPRMKIEQGVKIVFKDNAEYSQGKANSSTARNLVGCTGTYSNELVVADSAKVCWTNGNDSIIGASDSSGGSPEGVVRVSGANALFKADRLFIGSFWDGSGTANGKGVLIIDSGTVDVTALYTTSDAKESNSTAEIHLNGGKLSCGDFALRKNGTRLLYADGGTIEAKASFNIRYNTTKPQVAEIRSGGLAIDTQNYSVGLTMPFTGDGAIAKKGGGTLTVKEALANAGGVDVMEGAVVLAADVPSAIVRDGAVLGIATNVTLPSLVLESGATVSNVVSSSTPTCITTESLSIEGPVTIAVSGAVPSYGSVLTVAEGTISPEDFEKITFAGPDGHATLSLSDDGKSVIYWSGDYVWTGAGDGTSMSDADNWYGDKKPAAGESVACMYFNNASAAEVSNDVGEMEISKIVFNSPEATTVSSAEGYKFTGVENITTAANVHHVFNCPVECKDGVTPSIPVGSANYPKFPGGIKATWFAAGSTCYWSGKYVLDNSSRWAMGRVALNIVDERSSFTANEVGIDRLWISSANLAITTRVSKISNDGSQYRYSLNSSNWSWRWMLAAGQLPAGNVVRVGTIETSSNCPELYHSYATSSYGDSGIIIVNSITNGTTGIVTGSTDQHLPWIYLSRGYRSGSNRYAPKSGTWAIGPGGLNFSSSASNDSSNGARYRVGAGGAYLHSFADWTLALHRTSANVALQFVDGGVLTIDTDHYTVGEEEYDTVDRHNVTILGRVYGTGSFVARGAGSVSFMGASDMTGDLTATSGVSIAIGASARPCTGAIAMCEGTSLVFPDAGTDTTADLGEIALEGNNAVVFSNLNSSVVAAKAAKLVLQSPGTVSFAIEGESPLAPGHYTLFKFTGGEPAPDISNVTLGGSAIEGIECEAIVNDTFMSICVHGGYDGNPPQMVKSGAMSDASNWLGGVKPSTETLNGEIVFQPGVTNAVNDIGDIPVENISIQSVLPVTISGSGKFTDVAAINVAESVHHEFRCAVECKSGTTPTIPVSSANYPKFTGGITATNYKNDADSYWSGKFILNNSSLWMPARNKFVRLVGAGSTFSANSVRFDWYTLSESSGAVTARVARIDTGGDTYRYWENNNGNYTYRWKLLVDSLTGKNVLKVGEIATSGACPEIYHSYANGSTTTDSGTIEVKKIVNGSSSKDGSTTNQHLPWIYLSRGYRSGSGRYAQRSGTWAIGSGGLTFASNAHADARYKVGSGGAKLYSFEDWALSSNNGRDAIVFEGGGTLEIDTGHYVTGDPEIDEGATSHTVTLNGAIVGSGALVVTGGGRVVFNSVSTFTGGTEVATELVLKYGSQPGASTVSVLESGALNMPDKGCAAVATNIVFKNQSTMRFTIHDNEDTNKLSAAAVTLDDLGYDNGFVNVCVLPLNNANLRAFKPYTLLTLRGEEKLTEVDLPKFKLQSKPSWASRLGIVDGNLVLWPSAPSLSITVR